MDLDDGLHQSPDPGLPAADFVDISSCSGASGDVARLDQGEHQSPVPLAKLIPRCALDAFHKCDKEHLDTAEDERRSCVVQHGSVDFEETGDKADLASVSDHGAHGVSSELDPAYWEDAGSLCRIGIRALCHDHVKSSLGFQMKQDRSLASYVIRQADRCRASQLHVVRPPLICCYM